MNPGEGMESRYDYVMLIDDNEVDNFVNREIIKRSGIANRIDAFTSAVSALEYFQQLSSHSNSGSWPDVVFLDINMPVLDGFEFMDKFQQIVEKKDRHVKVVMLTSSDNPEDFQKADHYSLVQGYIVKPLKREKLKDI